MLEDMNNNTKLEVAVEIMASKIANMSKKGYDEESQEMKQLLKEKIEMYNFNLEVIDKIIKVYGPEVKEKYTK